MSAHTPGPWVVTKDRTIRADAGVGVFVADCAMGTGADWSNADRIVACVTALEGITDPAAFVLRAKELGA